VVGGHGMEGVGVRVYWSGCLGQKDYSVEAMLGMVPNNAGMSEVCICTDMNECPVDGQ